MALRRSLRIAFVDHRGFAEPPDEIPPEFFELGTILDDFEAVREELSLGTVVAVGHSGHSYMALEYAKKYPHNVSHVVMIGIAPDLSPRSSEMAERYWDESMDPERKAVMVDNLLRVTDESLSELSLSEAFVQDYIRKGPRAWYDPRFDSSGMWEGVVPNDVLFKIWGETFASIDIRNGLKGLSKPVLLALGRYDYLVAPPASWEPFRGDFQDLTIRVFERSGHTPQFEESRLFDSVLIEWLDSRS